MVSNAWMVCLLLLYGEVSWVSLTDAPLEHDIGCTSILEPTNIQCSCFMYYGNLKAMTHYINIKLHLPQAALFDFACVWHLYME